jgi:hypothetical protein
MAAEEKEHNNSPRQLRTIEKQNGNFREHTTCTPVDGQLGCNKQCDLQ